MSKIDIITITNISDYDFPEYERELNVEVKAKRKYESREYTGPFEEQGSLYEKPEVPVLMWDGTVYPLAAGESISLPRAVAYVFAGKIVDRVLLGQGKGRHLYDDRLRRPLFEEIIHESVLTPKKKIEVVRETVEDDLEDDSEDVSNVATNDMSMPQLRTLASKKGLSFPNTTKKVELIKMINGK